LVNQQIFTQDLSGSSIGGLAGGNLDSGVLRNSFAAAIVSVGSTSGGLVGINAATATITRSYWHDHKENPDKCIGVDSASNTLCRPKYNGIDPNLKPVSFKPSFHSGRKIGFSDRSDFKISGSCLSEGDIVFVKVTQGGATLTPSTQPICSLGSFSAEVDVSSLTDDDTINDASNDITASIEMVTSSCTQGSTCFGDSRALLKDATTCNGYTTNGDGFAAGTGADSGANIWIICDATQFDNMRLHKASLKYHKLGDNIDLSAGGYTGRIGISGADFNGRLYGGGFKIANANIVMPSTRC
jgi:hypothetical protein